MVINDLRERCSNCGGSGRKAGITSLGISQINIGGICAKCSGKGFFLTDLGQDLVDLLRPYIKEIIEEVIPKSVRERPGPEEPPEEG